MARPWLLLPLAVLACSTDRSSAPPRPHYPPLAEPRSALQAHACLAGFSRETSSLDVDLDGSSERVEVFETHFKYPFLARWHVRPGHRAESATWAVATHLLVTYSSDPGRPAVEESLRAALDRPGIEVRDLALPGAYVVADEHWQPSPDQAATYLLAQADRVRRLEGVKSASPDYLYFSLGSGPDDPEFKNHDQQPLEDIGAVRAWSVTKGSRCVKVAVVDTGIRPDHVDLQENIARRWDGAILGRDFHNHRRVPWDDNSHGTYCSGILGAVGDNGNGIAGVNWKVSILPIKVLDQDACGTTENIVNGIVFAVRKGATILSNSWGGAPRSPELERAVRFAAAKRVLFVAGAGNDDIDLDTMPFYPASFPEPNVISVGGVTSDGIPEMSWGHGMKSVHLSAPGEGIVSTVPPPLLYDFKSGTSASTAFVAGACALLETRGLHYLDIRTRLLRSSVDTKVSAASCSRGRLDLANAVMGAPLRHDFTCP